MKTLTQIDPATPSASGHLSQRPEAVQVAPVPASTVVRHLWTHLVTEEVLSGETFLSILAGDCCEKCYNDVDPQTLLNLLF